ncbi:MAG: hypothetical protein P1U85_17655 [Verrucomicrobiales bacterium]|nr:hypothetical protein [Verrucomicrobiales bacterium]
MGFRLGKERTGTDLSGENERSPAPSPEADVDSEEGVTAVMPKPFAFHRVRNRDSQTAGSASEESSASSQPDAGITSDSEVALADSPAPSPETGPPSEVMKVSSLKPFAFHRDRSSANEPVDEKSNARLDTFAWDLENSDQALADSQSGPPAEAEESASSVKLDYIFVNRSTDVPFEPESSVSEEEDSTDRIVEDTNVGSAEDAKPETFDESFVESPPIGALPYDVDVLETPGSEPATKLEEIGPDSPSSSDTLVETQTSERRAPGDSRESGFTSFDNGYIPEFEDDLKLVDEEPHRGTYATTDTYANGRIPDSWRLPPGQTVPGDARYPANSPRYYEDYPAYGTDGYQYSSYNNGYLGNSYGYESDPLYYSRNYYPGGPYGYEYVGMNSYGNDRILYEDTHFSVEGDVPLFTRKFDTNEAHFKIGGLYLQALSLEFGALYSDYDGPVQFRRGEEDGFLGYVGFRFRAAARISPTLFLSLDGTIIYLIGANEVAFRASGNGSPFLTLTYEDQWGEWDIRAFDMFGFTYPFLFGSDALERAGRYQFGFAGFQGGSSQSTFEPVVYNRIGVEAARPVDTDWRLTLGAYHTDYWLTDSRIKDNHGAVQSFIARLSSDGRFVPFSPWAQYQAGSADYFDSHVNIFTVGGRGRLTERTSLSAMFGYMTPSGLPVDSDHWLWRIGLRNEISSRTSHGVVVGNEYFESDFSDESVVSEFVHYYINHQFTETLTGYAFAQWSRDEFLTGRLVGGEYDRELYGFRLTQRLCETTVASLGYFYEESINSRTGIEQRRTIFDANINARLARDMTGYLRYRYEDAELFDESLYSLGVRKHF